MISIVINDMKAKFWDNFQFHAMKGPKRGHVYVFYTSMHISTSRKAYENV